ncbi:MAG TPA: DUF2171 domain-containing protein [Ktedonobacterales bacterium]|nr:DUF2171 domain-containing protein [Ktedonobacterales bacterium]
MPEPLFQTERQQEEQIAQRLIPGTPVYDSDGVKVGTVDMHSKQEGYLPVRRNGPLHRLLVVPLDMVAQVDSHQVTLNVTRQQAGY